MRALAALSRKQVALRQQGLETEHADAAQLQHTESHGHRMAAATATAATTLRLQTCRARTPR